MPQTREADAKKAERLRREHRHYTPDLLGRPCSAGCGLAMPTALLDAGEHAHATCTAEARRLIAASDRAVAAARPPIAPEETP